MRLSPGSRAAVLGSADGLTLILGLILGLAVSRQPAPAVWHAALAAGVAEFVGMGAAQWLSDGESGLKVAVLCGTAALAAIIVPALPYLASGGAEALSLSLALVCAVAGVISLLRPEKGALAVVQTYGVLVVAAVLSAAAALV